MELKVARMSQMQGRYIVCCLRICNIRLRAVWRNRQNISFALLLLAGTSGTYGGEKCMQGLVEKPQGKRPLRRHRGKWEDNIRVGI